VTHGDVYVTDSFRPILWHVTRAQVQAGSGTPEQIADAIETWFHAGAADGFNIMPPILPTGLDAFVDHVVPELQRRGLFRTEYTGTTLREHYGLSRPVAGFAEPALASASL
jgi:hypothetical protein